MTDELSAQLREHAFSLPDAWEDHPWGESVAKVGRKVFVLFGEAQPGDGARLGLKLPGSHDEALALPFTKPMGYGLDRGHWVWIDAPHDAPAEMLIAWIDESYRAVAPKSSRSKP